MLPVYSADLERRKRVSTVFRSIERAEIGQRQKFVWLMIGQSSLMITVWGDTWFSS